jgi:hypothetical protein
MIFYENSVEESVSSISTDALTFAAGAHYGGDRGSIGIVRIYEWSLLYNSTGWYWRLLRYHLSFVSK